MTRRLSLRSATRFNSAALHSVRDVLHRFDASHRDIERQEDIARGSVGEGRPITPPGWGAMPKARVATSKSRAVGSVKTLGYRGRKAKRSSAGPGRRSLLPGVLMAFELWPEPSAEVVCQFEQADPSDRRRIGICGEPAIGRANKTPLCAEHFEYHRKLSGTLVVDVKRTAKTPEV